MASGIVTALSQSTLPSAATHKPGLNPATKSMFWMESGIVTWLLQSASPLSAPGGGVGVGVGGGSGGMGGGIGVSLPVGRRDARAGTITIDVVDVAKKAQIWSGSLDASFQSEELSEREAQELVATILDQYPDRPQ